MGLMYATYWYAQQEFKHLNCKVGQFFGTYLDTFCSYHRLRDQPVDDGLDDAGASNPSVAPATAFQPGQGGDAPFMGGRLLIINRHLRS